MFQNLPHFICGCARKSICRGVWRYYSAVLLLFSLFLSQSKAWMPCPELSPAFRIPCRCNQKSFATSGPLGAIAMNCDRVVFQRDDPQLPFGAPIISYSQRYSGLQILPTHHFGVLKLPIEELDLSNNLIRFLTEKSFFSLKETLTVLRLTNNLLGDSLNPIFSTPEFHQLINLITLDLSGNQIKAMEEGILKNCIALKEIYLDRNSLTSVPSNSLNGPKALRHLSLKKNFINTLQYASFAAQPHLEIIDLRYNQIKFIDGLAFKDLYKVKHIKLAGNSIINLNSYVFENLATLHLLDISDNYVDIFPTVALRITADLRFLNLSSNMLQRIDKMDMQTIKNLEVLDLSRNSITSIPFGTFGDLNALKYLDLSLNSLRTIEDDALEGLQSLQTLILRDNNILLLPGSALGRLSQLKSLHLDFNRVAALSAEMLASMQTEGITTLTLACNVIRELPVGCFQGFNSLHTLDLSGNSLAVISADTFMGLETTLNHLKLNQNRISNVGSQPLGLGQLLSLDMSENNLNELPESIFHGLENLKYLNLSGNVRLASITPNLIKPLLRLQIVDFSHCSMKQLSGGIFGNLQDLKNVYLKNNNLQEIGDSSFINLPNISRIDLSHNQITSIRTGAFRNVMQLKALNLQNNQLSIFKGEFFNTGTSLELLDISNNYLSYLFPSSFRIHPRLKIILAANNKFSFFPAELIAALHYLEHVDLSNNQLKAIEELDFARLPRMRILKVANNQLDLLSEMAFHNSTQLQIIDLSYNRLDRIGERTFEGLIRLEMLNLEGNLLTELPEAIFEPSRLQMLENINLARNRFEYMPLKALQRQHSFVASVNLSNNRIRIVPNHDSTMVNIKTLDVSFNPLSTEAVQNILNEPKTIRELNLAGTRITTIEGLETPFLQYLNLSYNKIQSISSTIFERTTLLEILDLSNNFMTDLSSSLSSAWRKLQYLKQLDISNNRFELIRGGDFEYLHMLKSLKINNLLICTRIEKGAFRHMSNLVHLEAYNLPLLGYLDLQGILPLLPAVEFLDVEVKDSIIGSEQIQASKHPRLQNIGIRGDRLKSISSGAFAGLKRNTITIELRNTSLSSLPPALLFALPRSSHLTLNVEGSKISTLVPQFLNTLEDRRSSFLLKGLVSNPIKCDCNARALRRWLLSSNLSNVTCHLPNYLAGRLLLEVGDDELTCDPRKLHSTTSKIVYTNTTKSPLQPLTRQSITTDELPMIIWSTESTQTPYMKIKTKPSHKKPSIITNDDTLIIGIVGGAVIFIAILIIIICVVRLRIRDDDYHNAPPIIGIPSLNLNSDGIPLSYKGTPTGALYALPALTPNYVTLPHKSGTMPQSTQSLTPRHMQQQQHQQQQLPQPTNHSTRMSYFRGSSPQQLRTNLPLSQPYIIYSDDKACR